MEQREQISLAIAQIIRERSEARQLVQFEEILDGTGQARSPVNQRLLTDEIYHFEAILGEVVTENEDLKEISGKNGIAYYYSSRSLSETYAGILVRKEEDPLSVIARDRSREFRNLSSAGSSGFLQGIPV